MLTSNIGKGGGFVTLDPSGLMPDLQFHFAPSWFVEDGAITPGG